MSKYHPYWVHLSHQKFMKGDVDHEVKVTHLGNGVYGCRVFLNGELNLEYRCQGKENIGKACREALRMECKMGNVSKFAEGARFRTGRKQSERNAQEK